MYRNNCEKQNVVCLYVCRYNLLVALVNLTAVMNFYELNFIWICYYIHFLFKFKRRALNDYSSWKIFFNIYFLALADIKKDWPTPWCTLWLGAHNIHIKIFYLHWVIKVNNIFFTSCWYPYNFETTLCVIIIIIL